MNLRVNIIGLDQAIQTSLDAFIASLGHQVMTAASPESCCQRKRGSQKCLQMRPCCDALIFGPEVIAEHGLAKTAACQIAADNIAILAPPWASAREKKRLSLSCKTLSLPFECFEIYCWLNSVSQSRACPAEGDRHAVKKIL